ncbi:TPA: PCRF domain-containing protein, partial [Candidatus Poribacteria bacterium]|nr:PCRF domain-containing protein [Candidatus Poribacteria bacterium]
MIRNITPENPSLWSNYQKLVYIIPQINQIDEVMEMFEKLKEIENRYVKLEKLLADPEVLSDQNAYREYAKEYSDLSPIVSIFHQYKKIIREIEETETLLELE